MVEFFVGGDYNDDVSSYIRVFKRYHNHPAYSDGNFGSRVILYSNVRNYVQKVGEKEE